MSGEFRKVKRLIMQHIIVDSKNQSISLMAGDWQRFTLSAGIWEYWLKDKESNQPLTDKSYIGLLSLNETEVFIRFPTEFKDDSNAVIYIQRSR